MSSKRAFTAPPTFPVIDWNILYMYLYLSLSHSLSLSLLNWSMHLPVVFVQTGFASLPSIIVFFFFIVRNTGGDRQGVQSLKNTAFPTRHSVNYFQLHLHWSITILLKYYLFSDTSIVPGSCRCLPPWNLWIVYIISYRVLPPPFLSPAMLILCFWLRQHSSPQNKPAVTIKL